ncbi:hypothetical protein ACHAWU_004327 [Discostella pseudostelligera]|uniref:Uncharacterized protein n=1 Tax=Discostella pseudostelligera TaxID=259834 RepID=A0ABD3M382_9STRA
MAGTSPMLSVSAPAPEPTTETFQKQYGRGAGYPDDRHHHQFNLHGHPPPPQPQQFHPAPYASTSNTIHQHPPYHGHGHGGVPPPASEYQHPTPPWYYPPQNNNPVPVAHHREITSASTSSLRNASNNLNNVPPSLVTPKSHDSETMPPVGVGSTATTTTSSGQLLQKPTAKNANKKSAKSKKKDSDIKSPALNTEKEPGMEEEPKVEPMKQDFHFYAVDHYKEVHQACQRQLDAAFADGSISEANKENHLILLTTLINARLIKNWEDASPSTRAQYLKKEEADRKRFMSEDEVASRHCATLTARKRSPKQSGVERAESFGLTSTVEVPMLTGSSFSRRGGDAASRAGDKRKGDEADIDMDESPSEIYEGGM